MAEKILNTRIMLKYDSYENWVANDPVLKQGEAAIAVVNVQQEGTVNFVPSCLIKIGDGTHKYSELDFVYAKAADVIAACKSESALTAFVNNVIAGAGIATDEALSALTTRVGTAESNITALQGLVGDKSVATQIQNAIAALNLADTYAAKSHIHNMADVTGLSQAFTDAQTYVDNKLGNVGEDKGTVTARINAIEEELAAAVTFEPITEAEVTALFAE